MTPADLSPAARLAREGDEERFLAAMFAPAPARERLFALIAFNCELAKIPATVSEPMLGEIRLAWWREALDDLFEAGVVRAHEAIAALAATRPDAGWRRDLLTEMVDARAFSLSPAPGDRAAIDAFIDQTAGAFMECAVRALGGDDRAAVVARKVGRAEGAGRLIMAMPEVAAPDKGEIDDALAGLARAALDDLADARRQRAAVPPGVRAPLLSAHMAEPVLLAAAKGAPLQSASPFRARLRLLRRALTGRY